MSIQRVLIVDDDPLSREFLTEAVRSLGLDAESVADGETGLGRARAKQFDLVLTDLRMPGMDGLQLIGEITKHCPELLNREAIGVGARTTRVLTQAHLEVYFEYVLSEFGESVAALRKQGIDSIVPLVVASAGGGIHDFCCHTKLSSNMI